MPRWAIASQIRIYRERPLERAAQLGECIGWRHVREDRQVRPGRGETGPCGSVEWIALDGGTVVRDRAVHVGRPETEVSPLQIGLVRDGVDPGRARVPALDRRPPVPASVLKR